MMKLPRKVAEKMQMSSLFAWNANDVFLYWAYQNVLQGMGVCYTFRADGLSGKIKFQF